MVSSINDIIYNINYLINDNIVYDIFLILSSIYDIAFNLNTINDIVYDIHLILSSIHDIDDNINSFIHNDFFFGYI